MTELIELPPQRTTGRYRVEVVCMGNICRSPTAAVVLAETLADARLTDLVEVQSSGTGGWHAGNPMDSRSAAVLRRAGYDPSAHRARKLSAADLAAADLVLTMDEDNLTDVRALWGADPGNRLRLFGDFDPRRPGGEVPDPYYGGPDGFEEVLAMVERISTALTDALGAQLGSR